MKKKFVLLLLVLGLVGCSESQGSSTISTSDSESTSTSLSDTISSSEITSDSTVSSDTISSSDISSDSSLDSSSSDSSTIEVDVSTIGDVLKLGENYVEGEIGDLVKVRATYLQTLTWFRSNEDIMVLADNSGYIGLHVTYSQYSQNKYLSSRYKNQEYEVTANLVKTNGQLELKLNDSLTIADSFKNYSSTPDVNYSLVSQNLDDISSLITEFGKVPLNKKMYGFGKIVTLDLQLIATEYSNANKKALFTDGSHSVMVVSDSAIASKNDIGKRYTITGIMSVELSSPALWLLDKKEIVSSDTSITLSNVKDTKASDFKSYYFLSDDYRTPSYEQYMTLYKTTGYISYDSGRTSAYYLGLVDNYTDSLNDSATSNTKCVSGVFLMNNQNMSDTSIQYSYFYDYVGENMTTTVYYSLSSFDSSNHGWNVFPIENDVNV